MCHLLSHFFVGIFVREKYNDSSSNVSLAVTHNFCTVLFVSTQTHPSNSTMSLQMPQLAGVEQRTLWEGKNSRRFSGVLMYSIS